MSKASTTRTIKFIAKAGTYTALIMCPDGDIYQEWEGTESDVTKVFPNFEQTKPKLNFVCMSSRVAEGVATPDSMQYFLPSQFVRSLRTRWQGGRRSLHICRSVSLGRCRV